MSVLYHITNLPPPIPGTEASLQEIDLLRAHCGGSLMRVNPNDQSPVYLPRLLFGFHKLRLIRQQESDARLHHFYNADPFPFPFLRLLKRPIIYTVSSGVNQKRPNISFFSRLAAVTVSDELSLSRLQKWGLTNVHLIRPGVDTGQFRCSPLPLTSTVRIMVGSAPWSRSQFKTKGIDALLAAAQQLPHLHLICLWRGVLADEMALRVQRRGLTQRVTILNKKVDVNAVLAGVHASVVLVTDPAIIRAYPHSLVESLAAGKPILVNRLIPMSQYVTRSGCGVVVDAVTPDGLVAAIEQLAQDYAALRQAAQQAGSSDFSTQALVESFQKLYAQFSS